jgi:hypothetical protein
MHLYWLSVFTVMLLLLGGRAGGDTLNPAAKLLSYVRYVASFYVRCDTDCPVLLGFHWPS